MPIAFAMFPGIVVLQMGLYGEGSSQMIALPAD